MRALPASALALAGCAAAASGSGGRVPSADVRIVPQGAGATMYGQPVPRLPDDPLRAALLDDVRRQADGIRAPAPRPDGRLDAAAEDLARAMRADELPAFEVVDFLLSHYGIVEPAPHLLLAHASAGADLALRQQIAAQLPDALRTGPAARVGVGIAREAEELVVVVALQEQAVALEPVPRRLEPGRAARIVGRLLRGHVEPRLVITTPQGQVREPSLAGDAAGFSAEVRCSDGPGRYQVELTGTDARGSAVAANFPVFCGVEPPREAPRAATMKQGDLDPGRAEKALFELVNGDRKGGRLPPLAWDADLAEVARRHSRDMADNDFVGHVSGRTGNAFDRVAKAGLGRSVVSENVGRAYSPDEAERGLMMSPGHRANILDAKAKRIGIGVALGKPLGTARALYVTQVFTD